MKRIVRIALVAFLGFFGSSIHSFAMADEHIEVVEVTREATPCSDGIRLAADSHTNFEIYSITGQKVKSVTIESGSTKVELPKGCYIVRCPQWSKKVIVK